MRVSRLLLPLLLLFGACASGPGGYWTNRGRDLTDVLHVDVTGFGTGAVVNVGPAILGYHAVHGIFLSGTRKIIGLGGVKDIHHRSSVASGVIVPLSRWQQHGDGVGAYASHGPGWGSVGVDLGYALGGSIRVDFVEFADLLVGVFGLDLLDDDVPYGYLDAPSDSAVPAIIDESESDPDLPR